MIIHEYDAEGGCVEREATAEELAEFEAFRAEQNAPINELQEQIDDLILLMADMIGGE